MPDDQTRAKQGYVETLFSVGVDKVLSLIFRLAIGTNGRTGVFFCAWVFNRVAIDHIGRVVDHVT